MPPRGASRYVDHPWPPVTSKAYHGLMLIEFPEGYDRHNDIVIWVKVTDLMKSVTGSCDYGYISYYADEMDWWHDVFSKTLDTGFGHLVESIMRRGFLEDGAIGFDSEGNITEGHHRFCAAILLCLDKVPICAYSRSMPDEDGGYFSAHYNEDSYPIPALF